MTFVLYEDKVHTIVFDYENGQIEIKEVNTMNTVRLVNKADVTIILSPEDANK
jgi:hypothetical protein